MDIEVFDGRMKFIFDWVLIMESLFIGEKYFVSNKELKKWLYFDGVSFLEIEEYWVFIFIGSDWLDIIDDNLEIRRGVRG